MLIAVMITAKGSIIAVVESLICVIVVVIAVVGNKGATKLLQVVRQASQKSLMSLFLIVVRICATTLVLQVARCTVEKF